MMDEGYMPTILKALAEKIEKCETDIYFKDLEIERLKAIIQDYKKKEGTTNAEKL